MSRVSSHVAGHVEGHVEGRDGSNEPLLLARGIERRYALPGATRWPWSASRPSGETSEVRAVDGVDLAIRRGESLALVGESGSGKSTLARILARLEAPDAGRVEFDGIDLWAARGAALRTLRRRFQLVFQDAASALDPRLVVGRSIELALDADLPRTERRERIANLLDEVGLAPSLAGRYPHQLSGGQRQRVGVARALATEPELLILDEPVSALDAVVREQVLGLLAGLGRRFGLTLLFIGHDLGVIARVADRVAVLRRGQLVELGPTRQIFDHPEHDYTRRLIEAIPRADPTRGREPASDRDISSR